MKNKDFYYLAAFAGLYFLFMSLLALSKYWGYMHSAYDIGNMTQPIWNFLNNGTPTSTLAPPYEIHNRFGFHFTPIILALSPIYSLFGDEGLITLHIFFTTITSFIIFKSCLELNLKSQTALLLSIAFLLNPFVVNALMWDFRPISIGCFLVALSYLFVIRKNFSALLVTCLIMLLVKESFGAYFAGFGVVWAYHHREKEEYKRAAFLFVFGLLSAFLIVTQLMPYLAATNQHAMLAKGNDSINRYFWIFESSEVRNLYIDKLFIQSDAPYLYLALIFGSMLFLPLLAFMYLAPTGGDFILNLLSANELPKSVYAYHSLAIIPCLFIAIAVFIKNHSLQTKISFYILIINLSLFFMLSPIANNAWQPKNLFNSYDENIDEIKLLISDKPISAQVNIGGYFTKRKEIYPYPNKLDKSDFAIIHDYKPSNDANFLLINPTQEIEKLLQDERFELVYGKENWYVFKRIK